MLTLDELRTKPERRGFDRLSAYAKSLYTRADGGNRTPSYVLDAVPDLSDEIATGAALFELLGPNDKKRVKREIDKRISAMRRAKIAASRGGCQMVPDSEPDGFGCYDDDEI